MPHARRHRAALAACAALLAVPASAEPLLGPLVIDGEVGDGFWVYGQIDKALLVHDDGDGTRAYPLVDNASSSSRIGAWLSRRAAEDLVLKANVEVEWNPYSTFSVNRLNDDDVDWGSYAFRKAEAIAETDLGRFSAGQGSAASDGTSEADLSGTGLAGYSSVADIAGGQLFAFENGGVSDVSIGASYTNFDGLGRLMRVRWDSPETAGLVLSTSIGADLLYGDSFEASYDIALRHDGTHGGFQVSAAAAVSSPLGESLRVNGSASVLHLATGLNATLAAGTDDDGPGGAILYGKLGWRGDLIAAGETAMAADMHLGQDVRVDGAETLSFGLSAVQSLESVGVDLYAGVRWHDVDEPGRDLSPGLAVIAGALLSF